MFHEILPHEAYFPFYGSVLMLLIVNVSVFWWSSSWSTGGKHQARLLAPLISVTLWIEVLPLIWHWVTVMPAHWPFASLIIVLIVSHLSRNLDEKPKRLVRTITTGLTYSLVPPIYGLLSPVYLLPYMFWGESLNTVFWAFSILSTVLLASIVYLFQAKVEREAKS